MGQIQRLKKNKGFTLVELLAVVAIIGILCSIGMIAVTRYQRSLQRMEMDDTAKQVFLAAQTNLTAAAGSGALTMLETEVESEASPDRDKAYGSTVDASAYAGGLIVSEGDPLASAHEVRALIYNGTAGEGDAGFVQGEKMGALLLPFGAIDSSVRDLGNYVIVYDLDSARILAVMYSARSQSGFGQNRVQTFAHEDAGLIGDYFGENDERRLLRENYKNQGRVIGIHTGDSAEALKKELKKLKLEIVNGNRLIARIYNPNTETPVALHIRGVESGEEKVFYPDRPIPAADFVESFNTWQMPVSGGGSQQVLYRYEKYDAYIDYEIVLDTVESFHGTAFNFQKQFPGFYPGENLLIYASAGEDNTEAVKTEEALTNSLFAELKPLDAYGVSVSTAELRQKTSYTAASQISVGIRTLRHLENLGYSVSGFGSRSGSALPYELVKAELRDNIYFDEDFPEEHEGAAEAPKVTLLKSGQLYGASGTSSFIPVSPACALSFDGMDKEIAYFTVLGGEDAGIFGSCVHDLTVKNLNLRNNTIEAGSGAAGGLAARTTSLLRAENVVVYHDALSSGSGMSRTPISSGQSLSDGTVIDQNTVGSVSGKSASGGLVGAASGIIRLENCAAAVYVRAENGPAGGLIGSAAFASDGGSAVSNGIVNAYAGGHTYGNEKDLEVYGRFGRGTAADGKAEGYYNVISGVASGDAKAPAGAAGGLIGSLDGSAEIRNAYSTCSVLGMDGKSGSLIGENVSGAVPENCYALGEVNDRNDQMLNADKAPADKDATGYRYALPYDPLRKARGVRDNVESVRPVWPVQVPYAYRTVSQLIRFPVEGSASAASEGSLPWFIKAHVGDWVAEDIQTDESLMQPVLRMFNGEMLTAMIAVPVSENSNTNYLHLVLRDAAGTETFIDYATELEDRDGKKAFRSTTDRSLYLRDIRKSGNRSRAAAPADVKLVDVTLSGDGEGAASRQYLAYRVFLDDVSAADGHFAQISAITPGADFTAYASTKEAPEDNWYQKDDYLKREITTAQAEGFNAAFSSSGFSAQYIRRSGHSFTSIGEKVTAEGAEQEEIDAVLAGSRALNPDRTGYDTADSLFGDGSWAQDCTTGGAYADTQKRAARIINIRHLQNLDTVVSGIYEDYTRAYQLADLDWAAFKTNLNAQKGAAASASISIYDKASIRRSTGSNNLYGIVNDRLTLYDGNKNTIRRITINQNSTEDCAGLFREISVGHEGEMTIRQLAIEDATISADQDAGTLIGSFRSGNRLTVENVLIQKPLIISRRNSAGGLIGGLYGGEAAVHDLLLRSDKNGTDSRGMKISAWSSGSDAGRSNAGGLIGLSDGTELTVSYTLLYSAGGVVYGYTDASAGGLIGRAEGGRLSVTDSGSAIYVYGENSESTGGFIGRLDVPGAELRRCYAGGHTAQGEYLEEMSWSSYAGSLEKPGGYNVSGGTFSGGFIGQTDSAFVMEKCFSAASVQSGSDDGCAGGFIGRLNGSDARFDNCYTAGRLFAREGQTGRIGAFFGEAYGNLKKDHFNNAFCLKGVSYIGSKCEFIGRMNGQIDGKSSPTAADIRTIITDLAANDTMMTGKKDNKTLSSKTVKFDLTSDAKKLQYPYRNWASLTADADEIAANRILDSSKGTAGNREICYYGDWENKPVNAVTTNENRLGIETEITIPDSYKGYIYLTMQMTGEISGVSSYLIVRYKMDNGHLITDAGGNPEMCVMKTNDPSSLSEVGSRDGRWKTITGNEMYSSFRVTEPAGLKKLKPGIFLDDVSRENGDFATWNDLFFQTGLITGENLDLSMNIQMRPTDRFPEESTVHDEIDRLEAAVAYRMPDVSALDYIERVNTLFEDYDPVTQTAKIANSRHLLNLSSLFQNVWGKHVTVAHAVQTADILWSDNGGTTTWDRGGATAAAEYHLKAQPYLTEVGISGIYSGNGGTKTKDPGTFLAIENDTLLDYDGGGHKIGNLRIVPSTDGRGAGLFGYMRNSFAVRNLTVKNIYAGPSAAGDYPANAAALIASAGSGVLFENVAVLGEVLTAGDTGISVSGSSAGALIGRYESYGQTLTIRNCIVRGNRTSISSLTENGYAGGLVGYTTGSGAYVLNTTSSACVFAPLSIAAGGFFGYVKDNDGTDSFIRNCSVTGHLEGNPSAPDSLQGRDLTTAKQFNIVGCDNAGGFIGSLDGSLSLENSFVQSAVYGTRFHGGTYAVGIGGMIGTCNESGQTLILHDLYAAAPVMGGAGGEIGGIAGHFTKYNQWSFALDVRDVYFGTAAGNTAGIGNIADYATEYTPAALREAAAGIRLMGGEGLKPRSSSEAAAAALPYSPLLQGQPYPYRDWTSVGTLESGAVSVNPANQFYYGDWWNSAG